MHRPLFPSEFWFFMILSSILILIPTSVFANDFLSCSARFDCGGNIQNVSYPFWGSDRPDSCGHPEFRLNCNEDNTTEITIMDATYQVRNINSPTRVLRLARADYNNTICPNSFINSTFSSTPFEHLNTRDVSLYYGCPPPAIENLTSLQARGISSEFDCTINGLEIIGYYVTRNITSFGNLATIISNSLGSCNDTVIIPVLNSEVESLETNGNSDTLEQALELGFDVRWSASDSLCESCLNSGGQCGSSITTGEFICYCLDGTSNTQVCPSRTPAPDDNKRIGVSLGIGLGIAGAAITGILLGMGMLRFRRKSRDLPRRGPPIATASVEAFIKNFGSLAPKRYSYGDIKKMTNKFKDKLGQGGYGSVYKGKLSDDRLVAVKVLSESKGNGEDFMNEVASIGRTSHINIVTLLGFCHDGSKRALVYEFMAHGSLDKFIYKQGSENQSRQLEWQTLHDIALSIAKGLEYLHQGCNTRILHFDIKPHNILLDENFCPKISDFGLSKLCERNESNISMTDARGTIGYIAPEVFCRNFGGVSYKSDVYSYGMMVLEMVGGRRNIKVEVSQSSQIYFPSWIYNNLEQEMSLSLDGVRAGEEEEIARKLIVVSLWCIQTNPSNRPSMSKVLEMLQGSLQSLVIPPNPFVSSPT